MTIHITAEGFLIFWLALCGLVAVCRGLVGSVVEHNLLSAVLAAGEVAFLIWLVTVASS